MDYAEALRGCTENGADPDVLFGAANELDRLTELERRVSKRCAEAVPQWAPELRELLRPNVEGNRLAAHETKQER